MGTHPFHKHSKSVNVLVAYTTHPILFILFSKFSDVFLVVFSLVSDKYNPMRDIIEPAYQLGKNSYSFNEYIPTLVILPPDKSLHRFPNNMTFLSHILNQLCGVLRD